MIELRLTFDVGKLHNHAPEDFRHMLIVFSESKAPKRIPSIETPSTASIETSILAASWLENCLTNHSQCNDRKDKGQRPPSRLIDLGDAPHGLCSARIWSPGTVFVPYMTLSHRWGTDKQITLTKASLPDMSKRIDVANLSQTYQDAIAITRSLGLRYLWIDSLCIIQDSVVDWRTEAARIGDIYKFSVCTIAASWASSDSEGCFFDRGPLYAKFNVSKAAESALRPPKNVNLYKSYKSCRERRIHLLSGTMSMSDIEAKQFDCVLERRQSRMSSEIGGFSHNLVSSSLTHSSCMSASTLSLATDAKSLGDQGLEMGTPDTTSHSVSMTKHDVLEKTQPVSKHHRALENLAKIRINLESERRSAIQEALHEPARTESAVLYIIPFERDLWDHYVESSPLSRRAWVLQERLLSPRTLHYTKTQLFWECRESKACESSPHPYLRISTNHFRIPESMDGKHELFGLNAKPLYRNWPEMIEKYTDTLLSRPEDKLVAISGLARQVYSITKDKYCAGIWRKDLIFQLLWRLQTPQNKKDLPYRAPSWSWASAEGTVKFPEDSRHETSELEIKSVQSIGVDGKLWSFDQIEYGSVRLRGTMRAAKSCERRGQRYKLMLTDQLDEELDTNECDYYPDSIPQSLSKNPMCLPVARLRSGTSAGGNENDKRGFVAGLVIGPTGEYADEYRRLGFFRIAASAGIAWFGLDHGRLLRDVSLV